MRKNVKLFTLMLSLSLFATTILGGCSSDSDGQKEITTNTSQEGSNSKEENANVTIEEQVLFEQNGIVITAKEYVSDSIWGDGIKLLIENNSDKTVTVGCNALIVNNYMINDLFSSEVASEVTSEDTGGVTGGNKGSPSTLIPPVERTLI